MSYKPIEPNQLGETLLLGVDIKEIIPFIDWRFFFHAWSLKGKFTDIHTVCNCVSCEMSWLQGFRESDQEKAKEALKLYRDARDLLVSIARDKVLTINASVYLASAYSKNEDIFIKKDNHYIQLPTLRQQKPSSDGYYYALSDFVAEENDFVGLFANTVVGAEELSQKYESEGDTYYSILVKTVSDRLAEATAEWLHWQVRTKIWAYAPKENISPEELLKVRYTGIRPAVGYPSLPDQSFIFQMDKLLNYKEIGVLLTENGAMFPNASVSGMYFAHPQSRYFTVGKIDQMQLEYYAKRRNMDVEQAKKWLAANL